MSSQRNRCWCFTINNFSDSDIFGVKQLFSLCAYGIYGKEIGENGTPHLQGYIRLKDALTLAKVKKYLTRAHLEIAKGNDEQNKEYCSKQEDFYEIGEVSKQGKRNDIESVAKLIKERKITLTDVMFDYPTLYMKYSRSLEKMFDAVTEPRTDQPKVFWRWGLAGVGKTKYCIETHADHYVKDNTIWWDGYKQNEAIIIDDFDNKIPFRVLLRILDRYKMPIQVKGGYTQLNSPYIYITCEYSPEYFWGGNDLAQIKRRLTSVEEII